MAPLSRGQGRGDDSATVCLLLPHDPNAFQSAPGAGGEREGGNAFGFFVLFLFCFLFCFFVLFPEMLYILVVLVFLF